MRVEELRLENIKCFEASTFHIGEQHRWITLLGENGAGKSTALQALALLLAGPESIQQLAPRPISWLRDESKAGVISVRIHQDDRDPGKFGQERVTRAFGYSYHVTGTQPIFLRNRLYTEPTVLENPDKRLTWLRQNAFLAGGKGWFAAGYGPFRRLTRSSQVIVPSLEPPSRSTGFITQFNEEEPLSALERWLVWLDYRVAKAKDESARTQMAIGVEALNKLLPADTRFSRVSDDGRIVFRVEGIEIPTIGLSDGYRSILALAGDLIWRLVQSFPKSLNPLAEPGVVLIDELDIHLHPVWQRYIAEWLRIQFPKIQFFVATHSPLIAAGAGEDALTLKLDVVDGLARIEPVPSPAFMNVDRILKSSAFGLVSTFSPPTEDRLRRFDELTRRRQRLTGAEKREFEQLVLFVEQARPYGSNPEPGSVTADIDDYLRRALGR